MERSLLWGAFAVGAAGWLSALLLSQSRAESDKQGETSRFSLYSAVGLILVGHLVTMPSSPPFARGHGWGTGWLIGGITSLLSAWILLRNRGNESPAANAAAGSAPFFLALPAAVIPLLFMRTTVIDSLFGVALGWLAVSLLLSTLNMLRSTLLPGSAFAVTLCGVMTLAVFRGAGIYQEFRWAAAAAVIATGVPLLLLLSGLPNSFYTALALRLPFAGALARSTSFTTEQARESAARGIRVILSALLLLALAYIVSVKVVEQRAIVAAAAIGIAAALAAWWILRGGVDGWRSVPGPRTGDGPGNPRVEEMGGHQDEETTHSLTNSDSPLPNTALAVLVVLAGIMTAYQALAGFGVGIAVLSGWLVGGIAFAGSSSATSLASTLAFGTIFVVYRVAVERFSEDMRGVSLTDHYALFGFIFGLIIPSLLARFSPSDSANWRGLNRLLIIGVFILGAPAGIVLVWGQKALLTFLFGLALAATASLGAQARWRTSVEALIAMTMAAAVAQWTHTALPLAALPRTDKLKILAWAVGIVVILLVASDLFSRLRARSAGAADSA